MLVNRKDRLKKEWGSIEDIKDYLIFAYEKSIQTGDEEYFINAIITVCSVVIDKGE